MVLQVIGVAATLVALAYDVLVVRSWVNVSHGDDFGKFYYSTRAWLSGGSLYAPNAATQVQVENTWHEFLNMNPPHFHFLVWPLTFLSLDRAVYVWLTINLACALAALILVCRELSIPIVGRWLWPIAAYVLACAPTTTVLYTGQFSGILFLAMTVAWIAARHGGSMKAGLWLGAIISVKPFLGLFLPVLLVRREWRMTVAACVSGSACLLLGLLVFGWQSHVEWLHSMSSVDWAWSSMNASLEAPISRAFGPSPYYTALAQAPWLIRPLWMAGSIVIIGFTLLAIRRSIDHAFAGAVLASLLVSPLGWVYYLWLAIPGCAAVWRDRMAASAWVALCALLVPFFVLHQWGWSPIATLTIGSPYAWATIYLWYGITSSPGPTELAPR